jgi:hypothetical protein
VRNCITATEAMNTIALSAIRNLVLASALLILGFYGSQPAGARTLTFEDLSPGGDWVIVENGYEGLHWYYFGVTCGTTKNPSEGYYNGTVSPTNVAFNILGEPAALGCGSPFDLLSAYLTAHVINGMQVRVQGYAGTNLLYDNTYTLSKSTPTLINFNYLGVTRVTFTPTSGSQWFVMDNLSVNMPTNTTSNAATVEVASTGHSFGSIDRPFPPQSGPQPAVVRDTIIDQNQYYGGGGIVEPVNTQFGTNQQFALTIAAPEGKKFLVQPLPSQNARFAGHIVWSYNQFGGTPGAAGYGTVEVSFANLEGTAPDFTGNQSMIGYYNGAFGYETISSAPFANSFSFTSMTLTATVSPPYINTEALNYIPRSDCILYVTSGTTSTNDPGYIVAIVPANESLARPLPSVLRTWTEANGDVTVRFSGNLEHSGSPTGPFTPITGKHDVYTVPVASQGESRFFRSSH